ncbi:MAG: HK97 gp10 family phage protein [Actinomycetaceae bacterium]|nr:HK97 gp10 family phage protein [Arcanobacterium sp.]MDD7504740.1 HK97 gp10 family phage protein [Actinomycetaceae bacterium]MDY6142737.1 HK97 gp10 family phage protein [Arcanobacterium sp.]
MTMVKIYEDTTGLIVAEGLRETLNAFTAYGVAVTDLKTVMGDISKFVAREAKSRAPREAGKLAASLRGTRRKNGAYVRGGGKRAPYARYAAYGAPAKNITPNAFLYRTIVDNNTQLVRMLKDGLGKLADKAGLPNDF